MFRNRYKLRHSFNEDSLPVLLK